MRLLNTGPILIKQMRGLYDLAKEGGHSEFRVLHYKDITGFRDRALFVRTDTQQP